MGAGAFHSPDEHHLTPKAALLIGNQTPVILEGMTQADVARLLELPLPERYELAQTLWGSIEAEWDALPVTAAERILLDQSIEAYFRDPDEGTLWTEVKAELFRGL